MRILVGISGASGVIYGIRLIEVLHNSGIETHVILSETAEKIMKYETNYDKKHLKRLSTRIYNNYDFFSSPASGTFRLNAMVVIPCSTKTLSAVANGYSDTLISRAANCCLKEGRKLILVPRETPLDLTTIRNMEKAKEAGAVILPAMPAFYHKPKTISDMIDFVVGKIMDQLGIEHSLFKRWNKSFN